MRRYAVERRIVRPPAGGSKFLRFEDVRFVVEAPSGDIAGSLADEAKAAADWRGQAPLDPMTAWA